MSVVNQKVRFCVCWRLSLLEFSFYVVLLVFPNYKWFFSINRMMTIEQRYTTGTYIWKCVTWTLVYVLQNHSCIGEFIWVLIFDKIWFLYIFPDVFIEILTLTSTLLYLQRCPEYYPCPYIEKKVHFVYCREYKYTRIVRRNYNKLCQCNG